jgi:hypothetical protein
MGKSIRRSGTAEQRSSDQWHEAREVAMRSRKTVTEKQRAANRANGDKSNGPQTKRGKNASKFNATIWGLFAKHVVIPLCDGNGSEVEFERLRADLRQEYQPEGPLEAFCVAQVAESMWKLRRATRHEKGSVGTSINVEDNPMSDVVIKAERLAKRADILKKAEGEIKTAGTLSEATYGAVLPPTVQNRHCTGPGEKEPHRAQDRRSIRGFP